MLNQTLDRSPVTRGVRVAVLAGLLSATMGIAGFDVRAQSLGTFSGTVFDAMNRGIPNATLVLTNVQKQSKQEIRSDAAGHFEFVGLPPGDYVLESRTPGFRNALGTLALVGGDLTKDLTLQVGSLQETVSVIDSGDASSVSPRSGAVQKREAPACVAPQAGGAIRPPMKLRDAHPVYPSNRRGSGAERTIVLDARIGPDGTVTDATPVGPVDPDFTPVAIDAVRQWEFSPTLLGCVPIEVSMNVIVNFRPERPGK